MIIPDTKKTMTIMVARRSPEGENLSGPAPMMAEHVKDKEGEPDGRHMAAQDMMAAMHEKSPEKLMHALMNFMDIHHSQKE